jgi:hypothetical protein
MTRDELENFEWNQWDLLKQILSSSRRTNSLIKDLTLLVADREPIIQTKATGLLIAGWMSATGKQRDHFNSRLCLLMISEYDW